MRLDKQTESVQRKYNRYSQFYDFFEIIAERGLFRRFRKELISGLKGDILEIGIGTGKNLPYYSPDAKVTGIDISPKMLAKAKRRAKKLNRNVTLRVMDAQQLEFKNDSFDYVVGTFILCTIPDPVKAVREMRRVVKPKGRILLVEHVLSKNRFIALLQKIHNPIIKWLIGTEITRDTKKNLERAGIHLLKDERLALFDVFRKFTCENNYHS